MTIVEETDHLAYRTRWRAGDLHPGRHASRQAGVGGDFRAFRPFWQVPDATRIDVRRSILDPFDSLVVRETEARSSLAVILAADLSASMRPGEAAENLNTLATLAQAAARSAQRAGDKFGFIGFDAQIRDDVLLAATRARGAATGLVQRLRALRPAGRGAGAIAALSRHLPRRRCLILLVSDFLLPLDVLDNALSTLADHDVAPIILQEPSELHLPERGLLRLRDAETGATSLLLMRPKLRRRWHQARLAHRAALDRLFSNRCRPAFHITGPLDLAALSEHLLAG